MMAETERPEPEYGEYIRGNVGQVGRTVTTWHKSLVAGEWIPMVNWEPHPDEKDSDAN